MDAVLSSPIATLPAFWHAVAVARSVFIICATIAILIIFAWAKKAIAKEVSYQLRKLRMKHFPKQPATPQKAGNAQPSQDETAEQFLELI